MWIARYLAYGGATARTGTETSGPCEYSALIYLREELAELALKTRSLFSICESHCREFENSSSSPPQITRPSMVDRTYRYGADASQMSARCGQMRCCWGRVAMAHVEIILLPCTGTIFGNSYPVHSTTWRACTSTPP